MNDLFADVNRGAEGLKGNADDVDRTHYTCAESPRFQQQDCLLGNGGHYLSLSIAVYTQHSDFKTTRQNLASQCNFLKWRGLALGGGSRLVNGIVLSTRPLDSPLVIRSQ